MKISLCTVSMNRAHHIKQTLEKNIIDNQDYPDIEFILLDYNSKDDLEYYVKNSLNKYIKSKKLKYYKTCTPDYFNRSHSRNLAFKLATGDVICNVDADNFTGAGFAFFLNNIFSQNKNKFYYANEQFDVIGRIAVMKDSFYNIGGFDERMAYYGFEDSDFMHRLLKSGLTAGLIKETRFLSALSHSNKDRMANEYVVNNYYKIFLCYLSPSLSILSIFFKNNTFYEGTVVNRLNTNINEPEISSGLHQYDYTIKEDNWLHGRWKEGEQSYTLLYDNGDTKTLKNSSVLNVFHLVSTQFKYYEVTENRLIEEALFFYSQLTNRIMFEKNLASDDYKVNNNAFGNDIVYKNFSPKAISI